MSTSRPLNVVGLLLDNDAGTLEMYLDGKRMGLLVLTGLTGPMMWAADVMYDGEVVMRSTAPVPEAEDLSEELHAAEAAWLERCLVLQSLQDSESDDEIDSDNDDGINSEDGSLVPSDVLDSQSTVSDDESDNDSSDPSDSAPVHGRQRAEASQHARVGMSCGLALTRER